MAIAELGNLWAENPPIPNAVIASPFPYNSNGMPETPVLDLDTGEKLRGYAVASQGVEEVELQIFNSGEGGFWNGTDWVSQQVNVKAAVKEGLFTSQWQYCPPAAPSGATSVKARTKPIGVASFSEYSSVTSFTTVGMGILLGDANQDGKIDFLDIAAFIAILLGDDYLCEADTNGDGKIGFADIPHFIITLQSQ